MSFKDTSLKGKMAFWRNAICWSLSESKGISTDKGSFTHIENSQQQDPNMKARMRNFRTSGVVLCIDKDWFRKYEAKHLVS